MMLPWWWRVVAVLAWAALAATGQHIRAEESVVSNLENSLLSSFGLERRPRTGRKVVAPPYLLQLFHKTQQQEGGEGQDPNPALTQGPNTVRSFTHKESVADQIYPTHKMRLRFNVSSVPTSEVLHSAELRLMHLRHPAAPEREEGEAPPTPTTQGRMRRRQTSKDAPYLQRVMVYDVMRRATKASEPALRLLDTGVVDARQPGIQSLDITDAAHRWVQSPRSNHGLLVEVVPFTRTSALDTTHVRLRRAAGEEASVHQQPLLVIHSHDGQVTRTRRSSSDKHRKTRQNCRRHNLYVDFRKVGWDNWIVAPSGYDAYYCQGDCPFPLADQLNATNHAVVQTLVNSRYPDRVPKACCVPTELSPISLLYMDDDERFVLKNHQNMVVEGCGCR